MIEEGLAGVTQLETPVLVFGELKLVVRYWVLDIRSIRDQAFGWPQPFQLLDDGLLDVIII